MADDASKAKVFGSGSGFGGFAAAAAKTDDNKSSGFGSGFGSSGGFGSTATQFKGFGTAAQSTGFGFGAAAASGGGEAGTTKNLFDTSNSKTPSFGFGTTSSTADSTKEAAKSEADKSEQSAKPASEQPAVKLPDAEDYKATTGEENETVLWECRCKTHNLVDSSEEEKKEADATPAAAAAPSVPPSSSSFAKKEAGPDAAAGAPAKKEDDGKNSKKTWKDLGVGPLKFLKGGPNRYRIVQRYQGKNPDDPVTKVLLNIPFWKETKILKTDDAHYVQLYGPFPMEEGGVKNTTYSIKTKEEAKARELHALLTEKHEDAKSCFDDGDDKKEAKEP